ncbi:uncharacterized protein PV07_08709 [Cladophialophora immunda]|uniref:Uncharacterized protein n=1 Tax=Cladophialophora immunda TaxID=569365 RepID=A0A0D2C2X9_9EURO|nr:uncharacterized protein PV07_08709 [Cladophialophora immunda]KIW25543.1 hypothetical protein PV07_08709 [Cladophialophora immunda]
MGVEPVPVKALLDEIHSYLPTERDQNRHVLWKIGTHNMVIAVLPDIGKQSGRDCGDLAVE